MITIETIDFLEHHGVKGQQWGVRNKSRGSGRESAATAKLSNQELGKLVKRMQLNKSYHDVANAPKQRTEGKTFAHGLLKSVGTTLVTATIAAAVSFGVQRALNKKFAVKAVTPSLPLQSFRPRRAP